MTDIDPQADIMLSYRDAELHVTIPLTGQVNQMWQQRYEALAQAKDLQAMVRVDRDGVVRLFVTVPVKARGSEVEALLDTARALIAEADAVDLAPASSNSPPPAACGLRAHRWHNLDMAAEMAASRRRPG